MDMSTQMPMAGYFIYRSSEQADPTALEFCPPKGSDELFFALKTAYPHVKTHSDRMRNAVIEFLKQELNEEQTQMAAPAVPMESEIAFDVPAESPWSSWPSMDSTASTLSSPDLLNLATPASMSSSYAPAMTRQNSLAQFSTAPKAKPGLEDMTGVFSLSTASQTKTRVRRKMTESEKLEYRKRRIVKACDSCSKRKRKCSHNQPEMDKVRASKVTKPKASASAINSVSSVRVEQLEKAFFQPAEPTILTEDPFMFLDQSLFSEPSTNDHLLFTGMDNLFEPQVLQAPEHVPSTAWPWSDTPDWTLIDTPLLTQTSPSSPSYHQTLFPVSTGLLSPQPTPQLEIIHEPAEQLRVSEPSTTEQTPTRTWRTFSDFSRTAFSTADGLDGKEQFASMGLSTPGGSHELSPAQLRTQHPTMVTLTGIKSSASSGFGSGSGSESSQSVASAASLRASPLLVSQPQGLTNNVIRDESRRLQDMRESAGGSGIADGLGHVLTDGMISSSEISEDGYIGNSIQRRISRSTGTHRVLPAASCQNGLSVQSSSQVNTGESGLRQQEIGLSSGLPSGTLSSSSANTSGQPSGVIARSSNDGLSAILQQKPTTSRGVSRGLSNEEAPSAARPSSLSADSTSTSSSSSISRTTPSDRRSQAASPDLHGGLRATAAANNPSTPVHTIVHDKDFARENLVTQTEARPEVSNSDNSPVQGEQMPMLPLKSGARATHGRMSVVAGQASAPVATTLQVAVTTPEQPLRHKLKHSVNATADLELKSTSLAAAVLVAQVTMAWRAVATAFVQAVSIRSSCAASSDCQSLPVHRAMLLAA